MKNIWTLCLLFALQNVFAQTSAHFGVDKFAPVDGKKLLIIGQDLGSVGGLANYSNGYVDQLTDHIPAGVTTYTSLPSLAGLRTLANWGAGDVQAEAYVNDQTFEHSTIAIGLYLVNQLEDIVAGNQDNAIASLASWIKAQERPVYLRIGYEFDGPWNNYEPEAFKKAWRYLVHRFDEADVRNVAYVWQSAGINTANIDRWYPGDEYVNWLGYSHFDGPNPGQSIRSFAQSHDKPIMIAEATPRRDLKTGTGENHWQVWYQGLFNRIYSSDNIKALAYINADWDSQPMWVGQGWGDSRVQINEYVRGRWSEEMARSAWCMASDSLFDQLDYEEWTSSPLGIPSDPNFEAEFSISDSAGHLLLRSLDGSPIGQLELWDIQGRLVSRRWEDTDSHLLSSTTGSPEWRLLRVRRGTRVINKIIILK